MLTEAEKKWLEGKSDADYPAPASSPKYCPIASDFRDAAEFEARVAAKLTHSHDELTVCDGFDATCHSETLTCWECRLKHARLVVEEEMENGRTV